jgi:PAS domain-containing protein
MKNKSDTGPTALIQDLQVHQVELELQNQELILAREAAREAEQKYLELYDQAPVGYLTLSAECQIQKLNIEAAHLLGKERSGLINSDLRFFILEKDRISFADFMDRIITGAGKETCEVVLTGNNQPPLSVLLDGKLSDNGLECLITMTDITPLRQTQAELGEQEVRYRNLADSGMALIWTSGTDKLCNYFNLPWLKFTGRTLDQELGNGWTEGVHRMTGRCVFLFTPMRSTGRNPLGWSTGF